MTVPRDQIADFCRRWGIPRLWLFGSFVRGDAGPGSDVDLLTEFAPTFSASTWDWPQVTGELEKLFGRPVDLLSTGILSNPHRRASILAHREIIYAAA